MLSLGNIVWSYTRLCKIIFSKKIRLTNVDLVTAPNVALCADIPPKCCQASSMKNNTSVLRVRLFMISDTELQ